MTNAQPVRELQQMLRTLAAHWPQLPQVAMDGVFGEHTLEAVMIFQRDSGLPVTGTVDEATWRAIKRSSMAPLPRRFRHGTEDPILMLYRFMFNALSHAVCGFTRCELDTPDFTDNLRHLQQISALPVTGKADAAAWRKLERLFRLFVMRNWPRS